LPLGDGLVSTSAQELQDGGGSGLSGLHGHSRFVVVVVVTGGGVVEAGGAAASVVVVTGGGAAGGRSVVVVVVVVVVDEDGLLLEGLLIEDEAGLEPVVGITVAQFKPGFVESLGWLPEPSRRTPSSTPAKADAATAPPHAAQSTRTANSFSTNKHVGSVRPRQYRWFGVG